MNIELAISTSWSFLTITIPSLELPHLFPMLVADLGIYPFNLIPIFRIQSGSRDGDIVGKLLRSERRNVFLESATALPHRFSTLVSKELPLLPIVRWARSVMDVTATGMHRQPGDRCNHPDDHQAKVEDRTVHVDLLLLEEIIRFGRRMSWEALVQ